MVNFKTSEATKAYDDAHKNSDTDNEASSIHHTLGPSPVQAAAGNHTHPQDIFVGEIVMSGGATAPNDNFLPADGQLLLRADWPAVFNYYGTAHNIGGETALQFRLPNLNGRFPLGRSVTHPVGQQGGEETHLLTADELPDHNHGVRGATGGAPSNTGDRFVRGTTGDDGSFRTQGTFKGSAYGSPPVAGVAHNNMPPYTGLLFLVRMKIG